MFLPVTAKAVVPRSHVSAALGEVGRAQARRLLEALPGYRSTPLVALPGLAADSGVAAIHVKDEGQRFGLKSFKALGGAYAVVSLVLDEAGRRLRRQIPPSDLSLAAVREVASTMTFAAATDGNHGRSVAWGAQLAGAGCEIFIHAGVSEGRATAMAAFGANINRVDGSYDDSVELAAKRAEENGWTVVSDTAWSGYEDIPLTVMKGYTVMIGEALDELGQPPTHVFLQAGVGGMAAAVASYAHQRLGSAAPKIIIVEPARAACLYESAKAGRLVTIGHQEPTVMAMLECATPSPLAWEVLSHLADGYVTLDEHEATDAMRLLAGVGEKATAPKRSAASDPANPPNRNTGGADPIIVAGESGGTGLAGFLACNVDPGVRAHLGLDARSRILVFNSEGATDPVIYAQIVGRTPEEVLS